MASSQNRMLKDGKLNAYWGMVNDNIQATANLMRSSPRARAARLATQGERFARMPELPRP
jgi:hypothetical protein